MERICSLQEQFDKDLALLPDAQTSTQSFDDDMEDFSSRDYGLKMSFLRLYQMMHITIFLALIYFCNICIWYIMSRNSLPKNLGYKFKVTIPS